ncbi:hypothetical protein [Roseomonas fluvialis]|uniref:Uncharacterized protein n=1 Tax=Roseomonas fluvialis TaxID=1750527 RepID=A0ABM7XYK7_9PROT|nr:hypothetical protein [Roseomonas fluvialis]BDG70518.1 hypothetical protein Rmf_04470 [Roseomonas fluvialis]
MEHTFPDCAPAVTPPRDALRHLLCAAQRGDATGYQALLRWAAQRGRDNHAPEAELQRALILLDHLRHTYDPRRCPLRWVDAILHQATRLHARRA